MNNKISLIVPTSGQVENLIRCVESIQKQTKLPHEIFIIDNSQDRRVSQVLRRFKNKLPSMQIVKEGEKGASFARNKGIQQAHYDILAFIDDDCVALPNWLEKLVLPFTKLSGDFVIKGENINGLSASLIETVEYVRDSLFFKTSYYKRNGALYSRWLDSKNFAIKKSTIIRHQLSFHNYHITEDLDFSLQLAQSEIPILVNEQAQALHFAKRNLINFFARSVQIGLDQQMLNHNWPGPMLNTLNFNRYFFMSNKLTKNRSIIIDKQIEHVKLTFLHRLLLYLSSRLTFLTTLWARIFIHYPTCIIGLKDLSLLSNLPIHKRTQYLLNLYSSSYFFRHIQSLILKNDFTHAIDEVIDFIYSHKSILKLSFINVPKRFVTLYVNDYKTNNNYAAIRNVEKLKAIIKKSKINQEYKTGIQEEIENSGSLAVLLVEKHKSSVVFVNIMHELNAWLLSLCGGSGAYGLGIIPEWRTLLPSKESICQLDTFFYGKKK